MSEFHRTSLRCFQTTTRSFEKIQKNSIMQIGTAGALFLSVSSSVSIVIVNKYLISTLGFPYVTCLTATHMAVTAVALRVAEKMGYVEAKAIERKALVRFSCLNGISVAFLNLSLGFNSVGFYQMTKLAIIPCTVGIQQVYYFKQFSGEVKGSLFILLSGVAIATVTDLQLNFIGSVVSLLAIATTCVSQIWTNTMQKEHGVHSTQLLFAASPYMAAILGLVALPLDVGLSGGGAVGTGSESSSFGGSSSGSSSFGGGSSNHGTSGTSDDSLFVPIVLVAALTCFIAVLVNFSTFLVIGRCDAVTYQVLGHLKTVLVLGFGFFVLGNPVNGRNVFGIFIALCGMVLYGVAEIREKNRSAGDPKGGVLPTTRVDVKQ